MIWTFKLVLILKVFASRVKGRRVYLKFKKVVCIHVLRRVKGTKTLNKGKQIEALVGLRKKAGESATCLA